MLNHMDADEGYQFSSSHSSQAIIQSLPPAYILWTTTIIENPKPIIITTTTTAPKTVFFSYEDKLMSSESPPNYKKTVPTMFCEEGNKYNLHTQLELYTRRRRRRSSSDHFSTDFFLPNLFDLHLVSHARSSEKKNLRCHKNDKRMVSV